MKFRLGADGWCALNSQENYSKTLGGGEPLSPSWKQDCTSLADYLVTKEGTNVLETIHILITSNPHNLEVMSSVNICTTLLKIADTFYSLPPLFDTELDPVYSLDTDVPTGDHGSDSLPLPKINTQGKRDKLAQALKEIFMIVFSNPISLKELLTQDKLSRLFGSVTTLCPEYNICWLKLTKQALSCLSSHCINIEMIQYIHDKHQIQLYLHNIKHPDMSPAKTVDVFMTLFNLLRDSSRISGSVLENFRCAQGYKFVSDFILSLEEAATEDSVCLEAVKDVIFLTASLAYCGFMDIYPEAKLDDDPWQDSEFVIPVPSKSGLAVRNRTAFSTLGYLLMNCKTEQLSLLLLETILGLYRTDNSNYFILKEERTLCSFLEICQDRSDLVQKKLFSIIEFLVSNLHYVPNSELFSICLLLDSDNIGILNNSLDLLIKLSTYKPRMQAVYRYIGLISVFVRSLQKHVTQLTQEFKLADTDPMLLPMTEEFITSDKDQYIFLLFEVIRVSIENNNANGKEFRLKGGSIALVDMISLPSTRRQSLKLLQVLILLEGGQDELVGLLTLICMAIPQAVFLKIDILHSLNRLFSLQTAVKETFRVIGGFLHVMSVLTLLDGSLAVPRNSHWLHTDKKDILNLVRVIFLTFSIAITDEPANRHTFMTEIGFFSLADTLSLLGCFSTNNTTLQQLKIDFSGSLVDSQEFDPHSNELNSYDAFTSEFTILPPPKRSLPADSNILACAECFQHLRDFALDILSSKTDSLLLDDYYKRFQGLLALSDRVITYPGALIALIKLIPCIPMMHSNTMDKSTILPNYLICSDIPVNTLDTLSYEDHWALFLQSSAIQEVYCLMNSESNQQIMCDEGLAGILLKYCGPAMADEQHPLHAPTLRSFEKIAGHQLSIIDLRDFLRLGNPLRCKAHEVFNGIPNDRTKLFKDQFATLQEDNLLDSPGIDPLEIPSVLSQLDPPATHQGGSITLNRMQSLVSISTPRDAGYKKLDCSIPFIELDLRYDGFAGIFIPSIFPQNVSSNQPNATLQQSGHMLIGGIGTSERVFPSVNGITLSCWLQIIQPYDVIKLFTLIRSFVAHDKPQDLICFQVEYECASKTLFVSTKEILIDRNHTITKQIKRAQAKGYDVSFQLENVIEPCNWHHIAITLCRTKTGVRLANVTLFVDGKCIQSQKIQYFLQVVPITLTTGSPSHIYQHNISGYLGTYFSERYTSKLILRLGSVYLFDESLSSEQIAKLYNINQPYCGNFQSVVPKDYDQKKQTNPFETQHIHSNADRIYDPIINEDRIVFGFHPSVYKEYTMVGLKQIFTLADLKQLSFELGLNQSDNYTPVSILPNISQHLGGTARSVAGAIIGYRGVRIFHPRPISSLLPSLGGTTVLLGLIAMADTTELLYAAVKVMMYTISRNGDLEREMDHSGGYQILGMLYKSKVHLLTSHILHMTYGLVGSIETEQGPLNQISLSAFQELLGNISIWSKCSEDVQKSLFLHLHEVISSNSPEVDRILNKMRTIKLVFSLLQRLMCPSLSGTTIKAILQLLYLILKIKPTSEEVKTFGLFVSSLLTVKESNTDENDEVPNLDEIETNRELSDSFSAFNPQYIKYFMLPEETTFQRESPSWSNKGLSLIRRIRIRDLLLDLLSSLLHQSDQKANTKFGEIIYKGLGFNWIFLFFQKCIHYTTVLRAFKLLQQLLLNKTLYQRFTSGQQGGELLKDATIVPITSTFELIDDKTPTSPKGSSSTWFTESHTIDMPGFDILQMILIHFIDFHPIYIVLISILLNRTKCNFTSVSELNLETLDLIFSVDGAQDVDKINKEAAFVLLSLCRVLLKFDSHSNRKRIRNAHTIIKFLQNLYNRVPKFAVFCCEQQFLQYLAALLFPIKIPKTVPSDNSKRVLTTLVSTEQATKQHIVEDEFILVTSQSDCKSPPLLTELNPSPNLLTSNPNLLPILKFLEIIIYDSFMQPIPKSSATILDFVLEGTPQAASNVQAIQFQASVLTRLMDFIIMAETIVQLPNNQSSHLTLENAVENIGYLANKLADKLWHKQFSIPPDQIYSFLVQILEQSKKNTKLVNTTQMYLALDRVILFQLSRPMFDDTDRRRMLESLCLLNSQTTVVLSGENNTGEFYLCLVHCLFDLIKSRQYEEAQSPELFRSNTVVVTDSQSLLQVKEAVERIWSKLLEIKRTLLEDIFNSPLPTINKYSLQAYSGQISVPTPQKSKLLDFHELLFDNSQLAWEEYCQRECNLKKESSSNKKNTTKRRKDLTIFSKKPVIIPKQVNEELLIETNRIQILEWSEAKVGQLLELQQLYEHKFQKNLEYRLDHALCIWKPINEELTRERGLWGPEEPNPFQKWTQDCIEGPSRQRKRLRVNKNFYQTYEFIPEGDKKELRVRNRRPVSYDSIVMYHIASSLGTLVTKLLTLNPDTQSHVITRQNTFVSAKSLSISDGNELERSQHVKPRSMTHLNFSFTAENRDQKLPKTLDTDNPLFLNIRKMLDPADTGTFQYMYPCARLLGLDTAPGILYLGRYNMYIVDGYAMSTSGDLVDLKEAPINSILLVTYEESNTYSNRNTFGDVQVHCTKISYEDVREILKRRYMLRENSMELFCADGNSHFIVVLQNSLNKIIEKIKDQAKTMTDKGEQSVVGISKEESNANEGFSLGLGMFATSSEKSIINLWEKGIISNFQYLMYLNTLAGRSYNDLMQYPVYPWVLTDYESEELDLSDHRIYRDFSKPMGALCPQRLESYITRRADYEDPSGDNIESFLYGTPFSSAMIVAAYMVRLEPYSQHFLKLQGGHFDLADRMFNSIGEAWSSASSCNMPDVKELIPEFFYLPDFLTNHNYFKLGRKQNGVPLNDVILPPWAKGDPHEFIRIHREALESEYVSMHLHEWIDLIFGYKQKGKPADEAFNVFHPWFYEGNIDIDRVTDPIKRNLVIGFIKNYGQMPRQLFKRPHKQRRCMTLPLSPTISHNSTSQQNSIQVSAEVESKYDQTNLVFYHDFVNLQPPTQPSKELRGPVGQIVVLDKSILAYETGNIVLPPDFNRVLSYSSYDNSLRLFSADQDKLLAVFEDLQLGKINAVASADGKRIFTAGDSSVIHVWEIKQFSFKGKPSLIKQAILSGHTAPITCLTTSASYALLLSGSEDCSVIMWDLNHLEFIRQLAKHPSPVAAIAINSLTGDIVTSSGQKLFYWTVNGELLVQGNHFLKLGYRISVIITSEYCEWDPYNVILTGSTDGVVRIWCVEFTKVSNFRKKVKKLDHLSLDKPKSRTTTPVFPEISEESIISDVIEPAFIPDIDGITQAPSPLPDAPVRERVKPMTRDTWERVITERLPRLTLHTSYHRRDNPDPGAITALTISKDYKKLYIGDSNGRVWQWSLPETIGGRTDRWINTKKYDSCLDCKSKFTVTDRKHHCRKCGNIFCSRCSKYSAEIPEMRIFKPVRVCLSCYRLLINQSGENITEDPF